MDLDMQCFLSSPHT